MKNTLALAALIAACSAPMAFAAGTVSAVVIDEAQCGTGLATDPLATANECTKVSAIDAKDHRYGDDDDHDDEDDDDHDDDDDHEDDD